MISEKEVDELVLRMGNRFLGWKLPRNFAPDHYISFDTESANRLYDRTNGTAWPVGTNLLSADQAKEMIKHILADELTALRAEVEGLRKDAAALWMLLDDIDTADDIAKSDDALYRSLVRQTHTQRFLVRYQETINFIDAIAEEKKHG